MSLTLPPNLTTRLNNATWPHDNHHGVLTEVRFAHPEGNNANDGLSWGSAKQDVVSAYDTLPSGGGVIHVGSEVKWDAVDTSRGLWLLGDSDPQFGAPPAGWRAVKRLHLIGHGGQHSPGARQPQARVTGASGTDRLKPAVWISGASVPITFENLCIQYPAVAIRLGFASDMTSHCDVSGLTFKNVGWDLNQVPLSGPGVELGDAYWLDFDHCCPSGNWIGDYIPNAASIVGGTVARFTTTINHVLRQGDSVWVQGMTPAGYNGWWTIVAVTANTFDCDIGSSPGAATVMGTIRPVEHYRRQAIAHDVAEYGNYAPARLITIKHATFRTAGFSYRPYPGISGGSIHMEDITYEGNWGTEPDPPVFHLRAAYGSRLVSRYTGGNLINGVTMADSFPGAYAVKVDGPDSDPTHVTVIGASVDGPATVLSGQVRRYQSGIEGGVYHGRTLAQARSLGVASARFPNLVSQDPADWTGFGGAVITGGQEDPAGGSDAALVTSVGVHDYRECCRIDRVVDVGDWVVAGVWRRKADGGTVWSDWNTAMFVAGNCVFETGNSYFVFSGPPVSDDGSWRWLSIGAKVATGSASAQLIFEVRVEADEEVQYFAPLVLHIPAASALSDDEMLAFAEAVQTWPSSVPQGAVSTLRGQKLIAWGGLGVGNSASATTPGTVTKKIPIYDETGAVLCYVAGYDAIT